MHRCLQMLLGSLLGSGAIALGAALPIGGTIAFPATAIAQGVEQPQQEDDIDRLIESARLAGKQRQNYATALATYEKALEIARQKGDRDRQGDILTRMASLADDQEQYEQATGYYEQALQISRAIGNTVETFQALLALGELYDNRYHPRYNPQKAFSLVEQALDLSIQLQDAQKIRRVASTLGDFLDDRQVDPQRQTQILTRQRQAASIIQQLGNLDLTLRSLRDLARSYFGLKRYTEAIAIHEQALARIDQELRQPQSPASPQVQPESPRLWGQSRRRPRISQSKLARSARSTAAHLEMLQDHQIRVLNSMARTYRSMQRPNQVLKTYAKIQAIALQSQDSKFQKDTLEDLADDYREAEQYDAAIATYQTLLKLLPETSAPPQQPRPAAPKPETASDDDDDDDELDRIGKIDNYRISMLIQLSITHDLAGNSNQANSILETALQQSRTRLGTKHELRLLIDIAEQYHEDFARYETAQRYYQQAAILAESLKRWGTLADIYLELGDIYLIRGPYPQAVQAYQKAITLYQKNDSADEINFSFLLNLGLANYRLGNYAEALQTYNQAAQSISSSTSSRRADRRKAGVSHGLGTVYRALGQPQKALNYYRQSLAARGMTSPTQLSTEALQRRGISAAVAETLDQIGLTYQTLGQSQQAQQGYEQLLRWLNPAGAEEENDDLERSDRQNLTAQIRNHLGLTYQTLGKTSEAIAAHRQALQIFRDNRNIAGEASALYNLSFAQRSSQPKLAQDALQQALALRRNLGDREGEAITLNALGTIFQQQQQPELALLFYKQAVTTYESIRQFLKPLTRDLQDSYTQTIAETYRTLADLLLAQGRVLEAQQVLELLKIQELRDYTRDTRAGGDTKGGAPLNAVEAPVKPPFDNLISLGLKLTECEAQKPRCPDRDQLLAQRQIATDAFEQQKARLIRLSRQQTALDPAQLQTDKLNVAANIVKAHPKSILIYPLVLDDKLWLVYGLQTGKEGITFASKEIPVTRKELSETVTQFRSLLANPNSDIPKLQQTSRKLYDWLIAPLRPQLDQNQIQTLIFSLDRSTRYIPLGALFDGQQYLTERFTLSTILTADLTNTTDKLSPNSADNPVLGLGLSDAVSGFNALPNVPAELDAIIRTNADPNADPNGIFKGQEYLNKNFTLSALKDLIDYRILHIATHGQFVSEDPEQSFLLLGNGQQLKVPDIRRLNDLGSIHLAVLSACETAKGGQDKEGIEVAGLSYYFLSQNVKSVIASLWLVNDASTSLLMQQFYQNLATGKLTKAEALRQAQLSLLQGKLTAPDAPARASVQITGGNSSPRTSLPGDFRHPYYWAPFILIGNSL
jgi:CHAT domain-containing protein/tetratricopeptide (TPR) repeat protein